MKNLLPILTHILPVAVSYSLSLSLIYLSLSLSLIYLSLSLSLIYLLLSLSLIYITGVDDTVPVSVKTVVLMISVVSSASLTHSLL